MAAGRGTIVNHMLLLILTNAGQPLYTMIYVPKRRPRLFFWPDSQLEEVGMFTNSEGQSNSFSKE